MSLKYYYDVSDVSSILRCSRSFAYKLIRRLNDEMASSEQRFITVSGKVPKTYFDKRLNIRSDEHEKEKN